MCAMLAKQLRVCVEESVVYIYRKKALLYHT